MSKRTPAPTLYKPLIRDLTFHLKDKTTGVWTIIPHNDKARTFLANPQVMPDSFKFKHDGSEGYIDHALIGQLFAATAAYDLQVTSKIDLT